MDPVQFDAVHYSSEKMKEEVSAVSDQWHSCYVTVETEN
jgi:hypothetical protein